MTFTKSNLYAAQTLQVVLITKIKGKEKTKKPAYI